ncbi:MAG TPA: hypothetical protein VH518_03510 [Tepidisphaeraceae bacterium]|jgi:hypothetical protein
MHGWVSAIREDRLLSWRQWRTLWQDLLFVLGIAFFLIALPLPALPIDFWHNGRPGPPTTGAQCLFWGYMFWPSNGFLLLSPPLAFVLRRCRSPKPQVIVALVGTVSTACVAMVVLRARPGDAHIGAHLWVLAHCCMCLAWYLPVWRTLPIDNGPRTTENCFSK